MYLKKFKNKMKLLFSKDSAIRGALWILKEIISLHLYTCDMVFAHHTIIRNINIYIQLLAWHINSYDGQQITIILYISSTPTSVFIDYNATATLTVIYLHKFIMLQARKQLR